MAQKMTSKYAFDKEYYSRLALDACHGNTARKLALACDEEYEEDYLEDIDSEEAYEAVAEPVRRREERKEVSPKSRPTTKVKYRVKFNFLAGFVFAIAISALFLSAYRYLEMDSNISQIEKKIKSANYELSDVNAFNAALSSTLDCEIDRDYIYTVAVGKLGMVYPDKNQVVYYQPSESEYVRQMASVPNN